MINTIKTDNTNILSNVSSIANNRPVSLQETAKTSLDSSDTFATKAIGKGIPATNVFDSQKLDKEQIQNDYADFVKTRWEELKTEHIEVDCKGLALKFLSDFTKYYKENKGIDLEYPGNGGVKDKWEISTKENPKGMATKIVKETTRPEYKSLLKKNPNQETLFGTNFLFRGGADANKVATAMTTDVTSRAADGKSIIQNHSGMKYSTMKVTPEVDINQLKGGDLVFIDHTGDGKWDHTVNVIDVEKDEAGKVKTVTMGVGSFDDMRDTNPDTKPSPKELNLYTEEVKVHFNDKGQATKSEVTWSSEPTNLFGKRYHVANTLMELKPNGKIKVGNWDF